MGQDIDVSAAATFHAGDCAHTAHLRDSLLYLRTCRCSSIAVAVMQATTVHATDNVVLWLAEIT